MKEVEQVDRANGVVTVLTVKEAIDRLKKCGWSRLAVLDRFKDGQSIQTTGFLYRAVGS